MRAALRLWSSASLLRFRLATGAEADIQFRFASGAHGDQFPFDGKGRVLAHAFYPGTGVGGDVHFDDQEHWIALHQEPTDERSVLLYEVTAHELGHALGLSHSFVRGSLMFPYYQKLPDSYRLHVDDATAIQRLYGDARSLAPHLKPDSLTLNQCRP
jgi:hypothetical protein